MDKVNVSAPGTIANFGPGFDVFGLALAKPKDIVEVEVIDEGVLIAEVTGVGAEGIPRETERNTAGVAAMEMLKVIKADFGVRIKIRKGIRPLCGLGSSAGSAAAAVYAINVLADRVLDDQRLVGMAARGERVSAGFAHVDNVAPSILGGFTIVRSYAPLKVERLEPPEFNLVVVLPEISYTTEEARHVLPRDVPLRDVVAQIGSCGSLVAGILKGDVRLIGQAVSGDFVVEPFRSRLIPGFGDVKRASLREGAYGCSLSGAGPGIFSVCMGNEENVAKAMIEEFEKVGVRADYIITSPSSVGCEVVG